MNNSKVHFSSKTDDWTTPDDFFKKLDEKYNFTLDPCASDDNHKCKKYYTKEDDGLSKPWSGTVFMNPPYGREIKLWMEKAYNESLKGTTVVCLVPARTDTAWWHDYAMKGDIEFIRGRLKFGNSKNSAPFPSAVIVFNGKLVEAANDNFMYTLIKKVEQWADDKGIIEKSSPLKQHSKTLEEVVELYDAVVDKDFEEIKDAIGDIQVTLIIQCKLNKIDVLNLINNAKYEYDSARDRQPDWAALDLYEVSLLQEFAGELTRDIIFDDLPSIELNIGRMFLSLLLLCHEVGLELENCLQTAYSVISKRSGKMINGIFVKEQ